MEVSSEGVPFIVFISWCYEDVSVLASYEEDVLVKVSCEEWEWFGCVLGDCVIVRWIRGIRCTSSMWVGLYRCIRGMRIVGMA